MEKSNSTFALCTLQAYRYVVDDNCPAQYATILFNLEQSKALAPYQIEEMEKKLALMTAQRLKTEAETRGINISNKIANETSWDVIQSAKWQRRLLSWQTQSEHYRANVLGYENERSNLKTENLKGLPKWQRAFYGDVTVGIDALGSLLGGFKPW